MRRTLELAHWKQDTVLCLKHYLQLQEAFRKVHKNVVLKAKEVEGAKGKGKQPRSDDIDDSDQPLSLELQCQKMWKKMNLFMNT